MKRGVFVKELLAANPGPGPLTPWLKTSINEEGALVPRLGLLTFFKDLLIYLLELHTNKKSKKEDHLK